MSKKNKNIIERFLEFFSQLIYAFTFYAQEVKEKLFGGRKKSDKVEKTRKEIKKETGEEKGIPSSGIKKRTAQMSSSNSQKKEQRVRQVDIEDILDAIQEEQRQQEAMQEGQRQQEKIRNTSNIYEVHSQPKPKSHITEISLEEIRKKRENEKEKLEGEYKKSEPVHKAEVLKEKTEIEKRVEKKEEQKKEKAKKEKTKMGWLKNQMKNIEEIRKKKEKETQPKKEEDFKNEVFTNELKPKEQEDIGEKVQKFEGEESIKKTEEKVKVEKVTENSVNEVSVKMEKGQQEETEQLEELKKKQEEQLALLRQRQEEQKQKEQQKAEFEELRRKQQEQNRLQAEERKKKEQEQLAEKIKRQQELEEIQKKEQEEIELLKREKEKAELELSKIRQREEEQLEILKKKQQEKEQLENLRKEKEEIELREKQRFEQEKRREEEIRLAQEKARRQEEIRLAQKDVKLQEEIRLAQEDVRRQEEMRLAQEVAKHQGEMKLAQEDTNRQEKMKLAQEEINRQEKLRIANAENIRQEKLRLEREKKEQQEAQILARKARQEQGYVKEEDSQSKLSQEIEEADEKETIDRTSALESKERDTQTAKKRDFRWIQNGVIAAVFVIALMMGGNVFGKKIASVANVNIETNTETNTEQSVEAVTEEDENSAVAQEEGSVTLSFVGDLMCHSPQFQDAYDVKTGEYNFSKCFSQVDQYLQEADLTIGNLETVFASASQRYSGYPTFNTPDDFARTLKEVGFDVLTTANNHSFDRGETGVVRTLDILDEVGISHVGTYRSEQEKQNIVTKEVNGIKFAFVSFTDFTNQDANNGEKHINYLTQEEVDSQMQLAKAQNPDCIVAMPHWGVEYETVPNDTQKEQADMLINAGADIVIGSHPHVVQKMGKKKVTGEDGITREVFVAYSLGNFTSNQNSDYTRDEVILNLTVRKGANGIYLEKIGYRPVYMNKEGSGINAKNFQLIDTITFKKEFNQNGDEETQNLYNTVQGAEEHIKMLLRGEAKEDENAREIESSASETETTTSQSSTSPSGTSADDSQTSTGTTETSSSTGNSTSSGVTTGTTGQTGTTATSVTGSQGTTVASVTSSQTGTTAVSTTSGQTSNR